MVGELILKDLNSEINRLIEFFPISKLLTYILISVPLTIEQEFLEILTELEHSTAPGSEEIIGYTILVNLINKVIQSGIFPRELNISKMTPLFYSGDEKNMNK